MKDFIKLAFKILKFIGRSFTFVRNSFLNVLFIIAFFAILFVFIPREPPQVPRDTVLRLDIAGNIVEEKKLLNSFEKLLRESLSLDAPEPETALQDILDCINSATKDAHISALLLNIKDMGNAGINQLRDIGQALEHFKETGKQVIAAEDYYTQSQYFLASYANTIFINPMGGVDIHGFGAYRLYFKDALDRLKITYNVFKVGTYKSALEPFTRNSMSPEDQQQNELWLSALWQVYTDEIAKQRNVSLDALHFYTHNIDEALNATNGSTAQLALKTGLVDRIATRQEIFSYLASLTKNPVEAPYTLSSANYLDVISPSFQEDTTKTNKVGLIVAEGTILPGNQPPGMIGGDSLAKLIKNARENKEIKALVLRISSGGGSAFASEVIRQELLELKKSGKPLVVSMGAVAASGGYWIAADADEIWASPATITGSIGIFGAIPTFEKTLAALGIYRDGMGTTPLAAGLDITQPLPEQLKNVIQQTIIYNYDQFLQIVADGRNIEKSRVAELAEGRVYDGQTAESLGLVDKLGSLDDALGAAAELAGLQTFSTEYIRSPVSIKDHLLQFFTTGYAFLPETSLIQNPVLIRLTETLRNHQNEILLPGDPHGIYAQCLINLTW